MRGTYIHVVFSMKTSKTLRMSYNVVNIFPRTFFTWICFWATFIQVGQGFGLTLGLGLGLHFGLGLAIGFMGLYPKNASRHTRTTQVGQGFGWTLGLGIGLTLPFRVWNTIHGDLSPKKSSCHTWNHTTYTQHFCFCFHTVPYMCIYMPCIGHRWEVLSFSSPEPQSL